MKVEKRTYGRVKTITLIWLYLYEKQAIKPFGWLFRKYRYIVSICRLVKKLTYEKR